MEIIHLNESKAQMFDEIPLATRKRELDRMIEDRKLVIQKLARDQSTLSKSIMIKELNIEQIQSQRLPVRLNREEKKIFDTYRVRVGVI